VTYGQESIAEVGSEASAPPGGPRGTTEHEVMSIQALRAGSEEEMGKLEAAWRSLQAAGGVAHPMYSWEWMETWWETFGRGRSLAAFVERSDGEAVAIAPFARRGARLNRLFTFRRMELLGTGEDERDEVFSEYVDMPARPGTPHEALGGLANEVLMLGGQDGWDDVVLHRVRPGSAVCEAFEAPAAEMGLAVSRLPSGKCPYVALPATLREYESQLTRSRRATIRRGIRVLEEMGPVRFQKAETEAEALSALDRLSELHQARWAAKGKPGVFASPRFVEFHRRFIRRTFALGWAELWTLRVGERPIACLYNVRYQRKISQYQSGVSPIETTAVSPGILANYLAIKDAIEAGAEEYDFMLGEQPYKVSLSNAVRELVTLRISRRCAKEGLRRAVVSAGRRVRRLLHGVRREAAG